jgi:hypothetical protein
MYRYLLWMLLLLAACSKAKLNTGFSFKVNGNKTDGNNYTATYQTSATPVSHAFTGLFYIGQATNANCIQLTFSGDNYITKGNYVFDSVYAGNVSGKLLYTEARVIYNETSGSFSITQIDTVNQRISGNFQCQAINATNPADGITITSGSFTNLHYLVQ